MKKLMFFVVFSIMMGMSTVAMAQEEATPTKVERQGNTFKSNKQTRQKSEPVVTPYTYEEGDKTYPIYMSGTGSCFILKISKNGNEYRKYLGEEISSTICREMGVEYKPKKK